MIIKKLVVLLFLLSMAGCATSLPPLKTVDRVDLKRYMGPWYVIACVPTFIETKAYNAIEEYQLLPNGTINTIFTFKQGGFDGPLKRFNPHGFVKDKINNSTWGMRFIWPFKAEFLITYLSQDYSQTIIGRNKRDYFWIQARTPQIPEADYEQLLKMLADQGYDITKVRKVPQHWNDKKTYENTQ